jgi:hypothetical protein
MKIPVLAIAALGLVISSCSQPASDKPVDKSGKENASLNETANDAAAVAHEVNTIEQAAEKATAVIEAESRDEIKATNK